MEPSGLCLAAFARSGGLIMIQKIPVVLMRGGTSKCVMLRAEHLPLAGELRDRLLLRLFGSPDPRQIDGLGGATSTTSKAVIIGPSARDDADVDYTFAQVSVDERRVDYRGNCGNCASAIGPFAVREGLVAKSVPLTQVRIYNTNTHKRIVADVPVDAEGVQEEGNLAIAGVPGTGARQVLWFEQPAGTNGRGLLPTGQALDVVSTAAGPVRATFVDASNPVIFAAAEDLGLAGTEVDPLDGWPAKARRALEEVRGFAAAALGFAVDPGAAAAVSRNIPKVGMVLHPADYKDIYGSSIAADAQDITARILSMGTLHQAFALTGAMALAAATTVPGSVAWMAAGKAQRAALRIGHPSGVMQVRLRYDDQGQLVALGVERTARRLIEGTALVPMEATGW